VSIDWFRSWHGAPTDTKWLLIAKKAGVPAGIVSAVVWALFDHASQCEQRGNVEGFDVETYAIFSGFEEAQIAAVIAALKEKNIIENGCLSAWSKRQPKREDNSSERVAKHRVTQCNAVKRDVTQCNSREEKIREEEEKEETIVRLPARDDWPFDYRELFWAAYPHKVGKSDALRKLDLARKRHVSWNVIIIALAAYVKNKPPDRPWCNPATWIHQGRWEDQPQDPMPLRRAPDV
jgi:hypothetical protein